MEIALSAYGENLNKISAVNQLTAEYAKDFRIEKDINLGVGYVNDATIPADSILKSLKKINNHKGKHKSPFNYGGAEGCPHLIQAIRNYYLRNHIGDLTEGDFTQLKTIVGANGATSILDAFSDIIQKGIVITADPFYYIFTDSLKRKGFELLPIKEGNDGINIGELKHVMEKIDINRISFFYIVTVNNPTGKVMDNRRKKEIVALVHDISKKAGRKIPVIFDKAYEDIIHNRKVEKPISGLRYDEQGLVFEIGTLSKVIAPALRIGYLHSFDYKICDLLVQRTSDIGFSASLINQHKAAWLLNNKIDDHKDIVNKGYRKKASLLKTMFNELLAPYVVNVAGGDAGFYFYLTLKGIKTGTGSDFHKYLTRTTGDPKKDGNVEKKTRLVYIPGEICSDQPESAFQLRISYGYETLKNLEKAVYLIKRACEYSLNKQGS